MRCGFVIIKKSLYKPHKMQTIQPNNFSALTKDFKVVLPEEFLYEKE